MADPADLPALIRCALGKELDEAGIVRVQARVLDDCDSFEIKLTCQWTGGIYVSARAVALDGWKIRLLDDIRRMLKASPLVELKKAKERIDLLEIQLFGVGSESGRTNPGTKGGTGGAPVS